jgi:hypothetical protein
VGTGVVSTDCCESKAAEDGRAPGKEVGLTQLQLGSGQFRSRPICLALHSFRILRALL